MIFCKLESYLLRNQVNFIIRNNTLQSTFLTRRHCNEFINIIRDNLLHKILREKVGFTHCITVRCVAVASGSSRDVMRVWNSRAMACGITTSSIKGAKLYQRATPLGFFLNKLSPTTSKELNEIGPACKY